MVLLARETLLAVAMLAVWAGLARSSPTRGLVDHATADKEVADGQPVGTWRRARTSWYGDTTPFIDPFVASRIGGRSAFGMLEWGGCGYTNGDGSLAFAKEDATAYSDDNPDWHGSCGRCYEVRCVNGPVVGMDDKPIPLEILYYFPKHADVPDEQGRKFPGNPTEKDNYYTVKCWSNASIVVKVVDMCPCYYCPVGESCRYQESCCYKSIKHPKAGQHSFDLSFWAFQRLAHPSYGVMMLDFRPVDCYSKKPVSYIPGFISRTLYDDMPGQGWAWFAYGTPPENKNNFNVTAKGKGLGGGAAGCAEVQRDGAITLHSRGAGVPGFEIFTGVKLVSFWIKNLEYPRQPPNVRVVISGDHQKPTNGVYTNESTDYCHESVYLSRLSPSETAAGGWLKYDIPMSKFRCPKPEVLNKIDFMALQPLTMCVDEVKLY